MVVITGPSSICQNLCLDKNKCNPMTGLVDRPWGFQEVEAHRFQDNRQMKVVRLSALCTGHLYPLGYISGKYFVVRPEGLLIKKSNDTIGKQGARWCSWLMHCVTSRRVAGSIHDGVIGIFHWHNPSGRIMTLRSIQPLTEKSTSNISWRVKVAGA